jgi:hypothetical protein
MKTSVGYLSEIYKEEELRNLLFEANNNLEEDIDEDLEVDNNVIQNIVQVRENVNRPLNIIFFNYNISFL